MTTRAINTKTPRKFGSKTAVVVLAGSMAAQSLLGMASAATMLSVHSGNVLVDEGSGFIAVQGNRLVPAGSRIMLKADAKASLQDEASKCSMPLTVDRVLTVPPTVPCSASMTTSAVPEAPAAMPVTPALSPALLAVGAAGAIGLGVALSKNTRNPASP